MSAWNCFYYLPYISVLVPIGLVAVAAVSTANSKILLIIE